MAALLTIAETIAIGQLSTCLSGNDNAKGVLFGKRLNSPYSPVQIATCTDALKWQYEDYPTDPTLRGTANYLIWMCGKYGLEAQYIISGGGGGGTVVPGNTTRPLPLDFIVNTTTSPIIAGQSILVISSFRGWNLNFDRGGVAQNTTDVGDGSSFYTWDRNTGTFSCSPQAYENELFRLSPI